MRVDDLFSPRGRSVARASASVTASDAPAARPAWLTTTGPIRLVSDVPSEGRPGSAASPTMFRDRHTRG